jgi:hypothetical protein
MDRAFEFGYGTLYCTTMLISNGLQPLLPGTALSLIWAPAAKGPLIGPLSLETGPKEPLVAVVLGIANE